MSDIQKTDHITILGLGHVGLTLGLALADVGYDVSGYDIKEDVRTKTRNRISHFKEKGLQELLDTHVGNKFNVVDSLQKHAYPVAYFVTVGTPFKHDNTPDYTYIKNAAADLAGVLQKGDMVLLRSTVPLGTTRDVVVAIIERESALKAGEDFAVAFAPERTVEGNAFEELRTLPQIIGGYDADSLARARTLFAPLTETIVALDSLEEAEVVKLINNTYRETVFAFANQVSLLSRAWGLDTKKVIAAANVGYPRSQVPFPSPGVGGYCLTKDAYLFKESARKKDVDTRLLSEVRQNTSTMLDVMTKDIRNFAKENFPKKRVRVGILGFAFKGKPETSDVRGSSTSALTKRLNHFKDMDIVGFDPLVAPEVVSSMGAVPKDSIEEVIEGSDIVVVMNNNPAFSVITPQHFTSSQKVLLFDTWGVVSKDAFLDHASVVYWSL